MDNIQEVDKLADSLRTAGAIAATLEIPLPDALRGLQRAYFESLLAKYGGNRSEASRAIQMHRNSMGRHCSNLGLPKGRAGVQKRVKEAL